VADFFPSSSALFTRSFAVSPGDLVDPLAHVQQAIERVEQNILSLEERLAPLEVVALDQRSDDQKAEIIRLSEKEKQLRKEKEQLREKENLLLGSMAREFPGKNTLSPSRLSRAAS
jgi:cell shape-determining protein MreC